MQTTRSSIPTIDLNDGTIIPALGFGTLAVQPDRESTPANIEMTADIVGQALRVGYRHVDTAQAYGTEAGVEGESQSPASRATTSMSPASSRTPTTDLMICGGRSKRRWRISDWIN